MLNAYLRCREFHSADRERSGLVPTPTCWTHPASVRTTRSTARRRCRCISSLFDPASLRTRFETIADERKLRQRQLTEDGNVEISGCDLREGAGSQHKLF